MTTTKKYIDIYCYLINMLHRICDSFVSTKQNKTKVVYMVVLCVMKYTIGWGFGSSGYHVRIQTGSHPARTLPLKRKGISF